MNKTFTMEAKVQEQTSGNQRDVFVMNTNNSCIVSKRSVEKLYEKKDNGFLRYFVKKFLRRSPLINRGYWLRMKLVRKNVENWLMNAPSSRKFVVNLGCGYDTLPFNLLSESPDLCRGACFVDVDYPQLIFQKSNVIAKSKPYQELLPRLTYHEGGHMPLISDQYVMMGCNLSDVERLDHMLRSLIKQDPCSILFVAEVSITYMDVISSDALIKWAAGFQNSSFLLLEQFLPDGRDHPFAKTMLNHFEKLHSPIKAVLEYPTIDAQRLRFLSNGWLDGEIEIRDFWSYWCCDDFVNAEERRWVDNQEPFDEWEEFVLFCSHYFILFASNARQDPISNPQDHVSGSLELESSGLDLQANFTEIKSVLGQRRHAIAWTTAKQCIMVHGGIGQKGRLSSTVVYHPFSDDIDLPRKLTGLPDVVAHSAVPCDADGSSVIILGGRRSPNQPSSDCWQVSRESVASYHSLPFGLYRHCSASVALAHRTLGHTMLHISFGGKVCDQHGQLSISNEWYGSVASGAWQKLGIKGAIPKARFGACMTKVNRSEPKGILFGGISEDYKILEDVWRWSIDTDGDDFYVRCEEITDQLNATTRLACARFGAQLVEVRNKLVLIGGVSRTGVIREHQEIVLLYSDLTAQTLRLPSDVPRPLLTGVSAVNVETGTKDQIFITGGSAVCFSFGAFWNSGCYSIGLGSKPDGFSLAEPKGEAPAFDKRLQDQPIASQQLPGWNADNTSTTVYQCDKQDVQRVRLGDETEFQTIISHGMPVIIEGLDLGPCVHRWDTEYLVKAIGSEKKVVIHNAQSSSDMDFLKKNFKYETMLFSEFMERVDAGKKMYLRSISTANPTNTPSKIQDDFPGISGDFRIPDELRLAAKQEHSSPLRISGPVSMWLHYDVMANVYCQIRGEKHLILFPPSDVSKLQFPPGASSSQLGVFNGAEEVQPAGTTAFHARLRAGDVLYIPSLWPHTAEAPREQVSIAVNIFFRHLDKGYAAGKDVYGNRDLQAYENGRRELYKVTKQFKGLPREAKRFYLERLAAELHECALEP